jgi:hypothetical protein
VEQLFGLYEGTVVARDDPEGIDRVRVRIPGICEPESAWALPEGAGAPQWGTDDVPPLDAVVWVQFVNGDPDRPVYRPGWRAKPGGQSWAFPEHTAGGPDVHVWGRGPVRLIVDDRAGQRYAAMRVIKTVGGEEQVIAEIKFDVEGNALRIFATTGVLIETLGQLTIDSTGDVQVKGRKVMPGTRPL